nr:DUF4760 domain-containing protein [Roseospira visakhapatnamensis]
MRANYNLTIRNKALNYSLYSNEHLRDARMQVEEVFGSMFSIKEAIPMGEIEKKMESHPKLHVSILTLLAHWESMALAIESDVASDEVCFDMVASTLIQHVKIFRNFIEQRREKNPRIYCYLMTLRRRWEEKLIETQRASLPPIMTDFAMSNPIFPRKK